MSLCVCACVARACVSAVDGETPLQLAADHGHSGARAQRLRAVTPCCFQGTRLFRPRGARIATASRRCHKQTPPSATVASTCSPALSLLLFCPRRALMHASVCVRVRVRAFVCCWSCGQWVEFAVVTCLGLSLCESPLALTLTQFWLCSCSSAPLVL